MAHVIYLTDGSNTIHLNGGNPTKIVTGEYVMRTPDISVTEASQAVTDGGEITNSKLVNVSETLEILITDTTAAALRALVNRVEVLLSRARYRQSLGTEPRVFIVVQLAGESTAWRSEILNGAVDMVEQSMLGLNVLKMEARIHITRRFFWESNTEIALTLTSQITPGGSTTDTRIRNHWDGSNSNYVDITNTIEGVLPAPLNLTLQNRNGASISYRNIHIGAYITRRTDDNTDAIITYQGEASEVSGKPAATADANSSGGEYQVSSWTGATNSRRFHWTLPQATLTKYAGRHFRVIARLADMWNIKATTYARMAVEYPASVPLSPLWRGQEVSIHNQGRLLDLGVVQLPPALGRVMSAARPVSNLALSLYIRDSTSGEIRLDFLQLLPMDEYRNLHMPAFNLPNLGELIDNGPEGATYTSGITPLVVARHRPIHVWPGVQYESGGQTFYRSHRLYILHNEETNMTVNRQLGVRASYRPRRLTL